MSPACARARVIASTRCANPLAGSPVLSIAIRTIQRGHPSQGRSAVVRRGAVRQLDLDDDAAWDLQLGHAAGLFDANANRGAVDADQAPFDLFAGARQEPD